MLSLHGLDCDTELDNGFCQTILIIAVQYKGVLLNNATVFFLSVQQFTIDFKIPFPTRVKNIV